MKPVVTLVTGARSAVRESAIAATLPLTTPVALILEGMPDGGTSLDTLIDRTDVTIVRIAPGCVCCTGNLVLSVTLNRLLRRHPARLFISLASSAHLPQIRQFLTQAPYAALLILTDDLHCL